MKAQIEAAYEIHTVYQRYDDIQKTVENTKKNIAELEEKRPVLEKSFEELSKQEEDAKTTGNRTGNIHKNIRTCKGSLGNFIENRRSKGPF